MGRMFCQATGYGGTVQQGQTVEEKLRKQVTIYQHQPAQLCIMQTFWHLANRVCQVNACHRLYLVLMHI